MMKCQLDFIEARAACHVGSADSGVGTQLAIGMWALFALIGWLIMHAYVRMSTDSKAVIREVIIYGRIICVFSIGLFLESIWTKVL